MTGIVWQLLDLLMMALYANQSQLLSFHSSTTVTAGLMKNKLAWSEVVTVVRISSSSSDLSSMVNRTSSL